MSCLQVTFLSLLLAGAVTFVLSKIGAAINIEQIAATINDSNSISISDLIILGSVAVTQIGTLLCGIINCAAKLKTDKFRKMTVKFSFIAAGLSFLINDQSKVLIFLSAGFGFSMLKPYCSIK